MSFFVAHARPACAGAIALYVSLIGSVSSLGRAAENAPEPDLSLQAAIAQTLRHNPDLAGTPYVLRAAEARILQAGLKPAPELAVNVEDFLGSGSAQGFSGSQTTFALSQVIELGRRRDRRMEAAQAARDLVEIESQARQLDVLAELTRRFIDVAAGQERLALSVRGADLANRTTAEVQKRVEAAKAPDVELHRARIAQRRAALVRESAERELRSARRKLSAMWGATDAMFGAVEADLFGLPQAGDFAALLDRVRGNPDFLRFASEARLRDAELRLAESRRLPDIEIGAGVRRLEVTQDDAFVASVSIPLFTRTRIAGAVAEAQSQRELVTAQQQAAFVRAQAQLFELHQALRTALAEATALRDEMLPELEAVLDEAEYAYRRGRYSYLEWTAAQGELLDAQRRLIEAAADAHRDLTEIERLTSEPLIAPN